MKRTNIYLDDQQIRALDGLAADEGISRAELIRRVIDREIDARNEDERVNDFMKALDATFGILADDSDFLEPARGEDERSRYLDRLRRS